MHRLGLGLFVSLVAIGGCSNTNPPVINSQRSPIVGGTQANPADFPTVIAFVVDLGSQGQSLCTGTLITPTIVLTAAHCVDPDEFPPGTNIKALSSVRFDRSDAFNNNQGFAVGVSKITENPSHPDFGAGQPDLGHDDDALITLSQAITDRAPSPVDLDDSIANKNGTTTTQVGYGISEVGNNNSAGTLFKVSGQKVESCGDATDDANLICFDQTANMGTGQCNGDSGGPALDGQNIVIGVVSFGDENCNMFGADTRPSQTAQFIKDNVPQLKDGVCGADSVCNLSCSDDPDCDGFTPPPSGAVCGNGVKETGEQCDHGAKNGTSGDTCSKTCKTVNVGSGASCGDGHVDDGEQCDNGDDNGKAGNSCSSDCMDVGGGSNGGGDDEGGGCSTGSTSGTGSALALGFGFAAVAFSRRRRATR